MSPSAAVTAPNAALTCTSSATSASAATTSHQAAWPRLPCPGPRKIAADDTGGDPFRRKHQRRRVADPARTPGYQCHLAAQLTYDAIPLFLLLMQKWRPHSGALSIPPGTGRIAGRLVKCSDLVVVNATDDVMRGNSQRRRALGSAMRLGERTTPRQRHPGGRFRKHRNVVNPLATTHIVT